MRFFALATLLSVVSAAPAALEARALIADTFAWPDASKSNGNIAFQYQIAPEGNGQYKVSFFNSAPQNSGAVYFYSVAAVGAGNDGTYVSKTLAAYQSTSFTIQQSGTEVEIIIDNA